MKKFLLIGALFLSISALAIPNRYAALIVSVDDERGQCTVVVNGETITSNNGQFEFLRLKTGTTRIQVLRRGRIIADDYIDLKPAHRTIVKLSFPGGLQVIETRAFNTALYEDKNDNDYGDDDDNDYYDKKDTYDNDLYKENGYYGKRKHHCRYDNNRFGREKGYKSIAGMKERIRRESFDDDKLIVFKELVGRNSSITSRQVAELISLFSFDESKLKAARFAYPDVLDRENFYLEVCDELSFSSSKRELRNFTGRY